jgi:periplasmic divalent cation tolerance protein
VTDKIVILVTCHNRVQARKIAEHLVEAKLAACVNVTSHVESIYRWKGKVHADREYLLVIKTRRGNFRAVKAAVCALHSYENPEVIALPIVEGSPDYLQWIDESVEPPRANS